VGIVYVIQASSTRDFSDAERYGKIKYLLPDNFQIARSPVIAEDKLKRKLAAFNDEDYLVLIGDPIIIGLATLIAGRANNGRVKALKWDRRDGGHYIPIQLDLNRKDSEEDNDDGDPFRDVSVVRRGQSGTPER
jgi:hypothetical protein